LSNFEIKIPELGDFKDVEVIEILVKAGDQIEKDQSLVMLETDKATMEVPATQAGELVSLSVKLGDKVNAGDIVAELKIKENQGPENDSEPETTDKKQQESEAKEVDVKIPELGDFKDVEVIEILVKAGDQIEKDQSLVMLETDKATMEVPATQAGELVSLSVKLGDKVNAGDVVGKIVAKLVSEVESSENKTTPPAQETTTIITPTSIPVSSNNYISHASPSIRKLARELGVDLTHLSGSGVKGRITDRDLKGFVKSIVQNDGIKNTLPEIAHDDYSSYGDIEERALSRIQKISGPRLHASWVNIPHVTQFDEAEMTTINRLREEHKDKGNKITPVAFIIKAVTRVLKDYPAFRSTLLESDKKLIIKKYFNIGFAVDTPNGLMVPVIKATDKLSLVEISSEIIRLSDLARQGELKKDDMSGSVFTISSLGGIGGTAFTPIINAPEVAIIGLSRSYVKPVFDGKSDWIPTETIPYSLSYDHRVIDGAEGARFIVSLSEAIKDDATYK
jgi:pyruvate dehydrogenase E2 component (dihydrolipoamide acetyltransferase)